MTVPSDVSSCAVSSPQPVNAARSPGALLGPEDASPFRSWAEERPTPFVLVSDHAGRSVPHRLGDMGVPAEQWERHIAWDIGIRNVARHLHELLGAAWIEQVYSRLVIDCNRRPGHPTSIPPVSDGTPVPANAALAPTARQQREEEILLPYHEEIARVLQARRNRPTLIVSLHSFTPEMNGRARPWQIGLLHDHDPESAALFSRLLQASDPALCIGDNEPYALTRQNDYTVPRHAEDRQLPALELEIRQDLITDEAGQAFWAERLADLLPRFWQARYQLQADGSRR
ncbi:N-formylglutamate amidohydrolase [Oecophyllibacter saccharovorans]|uniref:N-formylglutamate amidohydrolase n=1 Tax=Oecophyllibacter saccharovorans TaxID=2558360 RepID=A0A506UR21_9PROT|nr:N-formylglutamate amidohydrolase [Oecophyllibacter saccharovorans]TPW35719.1 N-formylglutamate amidohydrolase [Oecophyllibacter saccharovorans]